MYISSLMPVAERMRDGAVAGSRGNDWPTFVQLGEQYRDRYLAVAHGDDDGFRDAAAVFAKFRTSADAWEARALNAARRLRSEDQEWHDAWAGPSYRVPAVLSLAESEIEPALLADAEVAAPAQPGEPTTAVPSCVFCEQPTDAMEYLWSEWLCRFFADPEAAWMAEEHSRTSMVQHLRREVDQTVDCVCSSCVHGWMQRLDDDVLAFLPAMVAGRTTRLTPRQQGLLAQWGAKLAALVESLAGDPNDAARAANARLRSGHVHPGTQVLIGGYNGDTRLLAHDRDVFRRATDGAEELVSQSTFVVGKLFMQVFSDPWRHSAPEPYEDASEMLVALVPRRRRRVQWPPTRSIDDASYDAARRGEHAAGDDTFDAAHSITA